MRRNEIGDRNFWRHNLGGFNEFHNGIAMAVMWSAKPLSSPISFLLGGIK